MAEDALQWLVKAEIKGSIAAASCASLLVVRTRPSSHRSATSTCSERCVTVARNEGLSRPPSFDKTGLETLYVSERFSVGEGASRVGMEAARAELGQTHMRLTGLPTGTTTGRSAS